jgi:hypothetical protein
MLCRIGPKKDGVTFCASVPLRHTEDSPGYRLRGSSNSMVVVERGVIRWSWGNTDAIPTCDSASFVKECSTDGMAWQVTSWEQSQLMHSKKDLQRWERQGRVYSWTNVQQTWWTICFMVERPSLERYLVRCIPNDAEREVGVVPRKSVPYATKRRYDTAIYISCQQKLNTETVLNKTTITHTTSGRRWHKLNKLATKSTKSTRKHKNT